VGTAEPYLHSRHLCEDMICIAPGSAMITAITIQNFKGIGSEPFRLPIKPITLLFGPNSAGKSTILQAIHYAREVLEHRNLDAGRTATGGPHVDLGGFERFVHKRETGRRITLRFEIICVEQLPTFPGFDRIDDRIKNVIEAIPRPKSVGIEFSVAHCTRGLYVQRYSADLDGHRIAAIEASVDPKESSGRWLGPATIRPDFDHPILKSLAPALSDIERDIDSEASARGPQWVREPRMWAKFVQGDGDLESPDTDALPDLDRGLTYLEFNGSHGDTTSPLGPDVLEYLFSKFVVAPAVLVRKELRKLRYLGPLREVPMPGYAPPKTPDPARWSTGLAAWDILHEPTASALVNHVSDWLESEKRLATGYGVRQRRHNELIFDGDLRKRILSREAAEDPDRLAREVEGLPVKIHVTLHKPGGEGDVLPQEVGMGISQLLPIVVACLDEGNHLTCFEQPELHLHPKVQCELGDLMIAGALGQTHLEWKYVDTKGNIVEPTFKFPVNGGDEETREPEESAEPISKEMRVPSPPRTIIVETHSEHLILRLLRRIRETTTGELHDGIAVTPADVSICYVGQEDGESVPRTLRIDQEGEFIDRCPGGFFDERGRELFQ
jgi:hypothetical protein